ncbi:MAG: efflux RND transporter permease subunit [Gammaproteobacteria bacterium]
MGPSGHIAKAFQNSEITPLLALAAFLLGLFAVLVTPREEEPQIDVTFANVFIPFPGASAREVEHMITTPAEQVLSEIAGVKHIYSTSQPGMSLLSVEYEVGEERTEAIVRLYNAIYSNQDWIPASLGAGPTLIKPMGIDDVPMLSLTLWSDDPQTGGYELERVAHTIEAELKRVPGTRGIYTIGGPGHLTKVILDPQKCASAGITLNDLRSALTSANRVLDAGVSVQDNQEVLVDAGTFLSQASDLAALVVGMREGAPVYLEDVAKIQTGPDQPEQLVWHYNGPASENNSAKHVAYPAVTIAIEKKSGTNAVQIADNVLQRVEQLRGVFIPDNVNISVTRNYGTTANDKAQTLIKKLMFATALVVMLVLIALGWREAMIVGTAVIITLAMTLFASWAWGFTLNRVSLFALIFSIGILVDDAIVVVENIHRHLQLGATSLREAIPAAVDEVGGPTILATFAVIAALLPMAFVTGLMGPYMSPIPINASFGMIISLAIAFTVTPWMCHRFLPFPQHHHIDAEKTPGKLHRLSSKLISPFLRSAWNRFFLGLVILLLIAASLSLAGMKLVVLKMLPFDNKSEFQVIVDLPEGSTVEHMSATLDALATHLETVPEITDYQAYAGTAAPINFNGLVRQYYLRKQSHTGDIQVNLVDKHDRKRKSHEIAAAVREPLQAIGQRFDANVKIVEVPPGPPVFSPLVAEIYGLDYAGQIDVAKQLRQVFEQTDNIVDVDDSVEYPSDRTIIQIDRSRAARLGISQKDVVETLAATFNGEDVTYLHSDHGKYPVPVRIQASKIERADINNLLTLQLRSMNGQLVPLSEVIQLTPSTREFSIYHKDLLPVVYVTGDMAGDLDSPLYGLFDIYGQLKNTEINNRIMDQTFVTQPDNPYRYSLKWDGEWQITYETFRDMGIAYSVGLLLIYLLVVAQFKSYLVPLIIMAPIPLTIIGVMPGHALLGAQFTATSMIGMIALAGIIVRNSILLVDFIDQTVKTGTTLKEAVIQAAAIRAKPIILTGLAAMLGALFILDDPIFSGLAISLIFGILVSTLLTLLVIPVLYYALRRRQYGDA